MPERLQGNRSELSPTCAWHSAGRHGFFSGFCVPATPRLPKQRCSLSLPRRQARRSTCSCVSWLVYGQGFLFDISEGAWGGLGASPGVGGDDFWTQQGPNLGTGKAGVAWRWRTAATLFAVSKHASVWLPRRRRSILCPLSLCVATAPLRWWEQTSAFSSHP